MFKKHSQQICPITNTPKVDETETSDTFSYSVNIQEETYHFTFCKECYPLIPFEKTAHIILGLLLNKKIPSILSEVIHWGTSHPEATCNLQKILEEENYPRTPQEKLDNLFVELFKLQKFDGQSMPMTATTRDKYALWYFKNVEELFFYIKTLNSKGDIVIDTPGNPFFNFTFQGFSNYLKITNESFASNKCFIAMAFNDETKEIRSAIKQSLVSTGFQAVLVDEQNIESDKTINDEIIANLRKCKFCIADFCFHKNGVYFESGFALGLGKPVIYTCHENHFKNAHFDIKPLQHIIYHSPQDLTNKLIAKIEAWIK